MLVITIKNLNIVEEMKNSFSYLPVSVEQTENLMFSVRHCESLYIKVK